MPFVSVGGRLTALTVEMKDRERDGLPIKRLVLAAACPWMKLQEPRNYFFDWWSPNSETPRCP